MGRKGRELSISGLCTLSLSLLSGITVLPFSGWMTIALFWLKDFKVNCLTDELTVQDSFSFSKKITDLNFSCPIASLHVESLFTNIPTEETTYKLINDQCRTTNVILSV